MQNPQHTILEDKEKIRLIPFELPLIVTNNLGTKIIDGSDPKRKPDSAIYYKNILLMPIEFELYLSTKNQLRQLINYYQSLNSILFDLCNSISISYIKYIQYAKVFCFALEISNRCKSLFDYSSGEKTPLIIFSIKDNWRILPTNSISYVAFDFISKYSNKNLKLRPLIMEKHSSFKNNLQRFYFVNLLKIYGDEEMELIVKDMEKSGIVPSEDEIVVEISHDWVKLLSPEQLKSLSPEQLKSLSPEQLKTLSPEQLKSLSPEQLKLLSPEQLVKLDVEKIKRLIELLPEDKRKKVFE